MSHVLILSHNIVNTFSYFQGVESERCASFTASMSAGKPLYCKAASTLADGLAVPLVGVNSFETARPLITKMITIR